MTLAAHSGQRGGMEWQLSMSVCVALRQTWLFACKFAVPIPAYTHPLFPSLLLSLLTWASMGGQGVPGISFQATGLPVTGLSTLGFWTCRAATAVEKHRGGMSRTARGHCINRGQCRWNTQKRFHALKPRTSDPQPKLLA